jgi:thiol-disulfide isomerase/thioredoxin/Flp pilus assembly protein TadD
MKKPFVLALALASFLALPVVARQAPTPAEQDELRTAARTEAPADRAVALKKFISAHPDGALTPVAHGMLVSALIEAKAPAADIVAAGDTAAAAIPEAYRGEVYIELASALAKRGEQLDKAQEYAAKALAAAPAEQPRSRARAQAAAGGVQLARGEVDKAVESLAAAAAVIGDDQELLYTLGMAYEKAGKTDQALDAYIRSESIFLGTNTVAAEPLRALWRKKHNSLDGLDARLATAREVSRKYVIFESRKYEKQAPAWELKDVAGKPVKLSDFKGKVVVMDFWGSWCPPCRAELPKFQALYDKYKASGKVVFLGMNWERPGEPEARMKAVTDVMANNKYTFPVVIDHDRVAVQAYELEGFPTVYMIDGAGTIRYLNVGYEEGV